MQKEESFYTGGFVAEEAYTNVPGIEKNRMEERVYAGFFVRLAAYLIDWIIVGAALLVVKIPFWIAAFARGGSILTRDFIFQYSVYDILIYFLKVTYFVLLTYFTGATLGKRLLNIAVVSEEDRKPTLFEIIYRESVGKFLSGLIMSVGYIIIGLDKRKRGLHDQLADTCVVYCHKKTVYVAAPVSVRNVPYVSSQIQGQKHQGYTMAQGKGQPSADRQTHPNDIMEQSGEKRVPYEMPPQEEEKSGAQQHNAGAK